ncbi:SDR family NAD(P)-dependent oxidoreductase [Streptomyces sp. NBC_01764]|uniref:SDR family NAD(P)-dependent oxidoreductase n=1 Tax=Streptomyces sp. NBC_01764 TaxID=2975935 RepID=UPI00224D9C8F|nr:SDR family NAD(P)-dependent oxidoreductase [Streptomyces sp. NBC_01764]MCX4404198.1 SDR family NAD(P)-dependent oxidoreductase [Streptomyces sp. NBC_01764]
MSVQPKVVVITGASSGFGNLTARALAEAGHLVYAGMRATTSRNAPAVAALAQVKKDRGVQITAVEMDIQKQESIDAAVDQVMAEQERVDVVVHHAGHMVLGPAEAFTVAQLAHVYDVNVLSTQRVNRTMLPIMRAQGQGLLVWVGSTSTRGEHPPFLAPYFAAKAAMDALAESYAAELIKFGIETALVVPGAYPSGTNHFAHAGAPADTARAAEYDEPYGRLRDTMTESLSDVFPPGREAQEVADEIVRVVGLPHGQRPFRTHVDPSRDGSEVVSTMYDRIRAEFFRRIGIDELLTPGASL